VSAVTYHPRSWPMSDAGWAVFLDTFRKAMARRQAAGGSREATGVLLSNVSSDLGRRRERPWARQKRPTGAGPHDT